MRKRVLASIAAMVFAMLVAQPATASPLFGDEFEGAVSALHVELEQLAAGHNARAWDWLNPAQQRMVSRSAFVACSTSWSGVKLRDVEVVNAYPAKDYRIPGTVATSARSVALVARIKVDGRAELQTFYFTRLDGRFRWTLWDTACGSR